MTRVLQLRRGSTAQNDNFTGLPGEITMDTDAKTVRIHDGETLGGFALMRADNAATNTGTFDITTVPDEFWTDIVARHAPAPFTVAKSTPIQMNSKTSHVNCIFSTAPMPTFVRVALICQNDQAGYTTGDEVWSFGIGDCANITPNCFIDGNGLNVRLMIGAQTYWAPHRDTGIRTQLSDENWRILFYVYY